MHAALRMMVEATSLQLSCELLSAEPPASRRGIGVESNQSSGDGNFFCPSKASVSFDRHRQCQQHEKDKYLGLSTQSCSLCEYPKQEIFVLVSRLTSYTSCCAEPSQGLPHRRQFD